MINSVESREENQKVREDNQTCTLFGCGGRVLQCPWQMLPTRRVKSGASQGLSGTKRDAASTGREGCTPLSVTGTADQNLGKSEWLLMGI